MPSPTRTEVEILRAAHHQAGHIVIAHALGFTPTVCTVNTEAVDIPGRFEYTAEDASHLTVDGIIRHLILILAGLVSEVTYDRSIGAIPAMDLADPTLAHIPGDLVSKFKDMQIATDLLKRLDAASCADDVYRMECKMIDLDLITNFLCPDNPSVYVLEAAEVVYKYWREIKIVGDVLLVAQSPTQDQMAKLLSPIRPMSDYTAMHMTDNGAWAKAAPVLNLTTMDDLDLVRDGYFATLLAEEKAA